MQPLGYVLGIKHAVIFSTQGIEGIKILKAACCASRFYRPSLNIHPNEASMRFKGIHRMSAIHRVDINLASQS
jgi:single-stranded DNA-specific DHH superfamily exonuclease